MENSQATQQREIPHVNWETIWMWSSFSEEKQLFFNGYALQTYDGVILIDPPSASDPIFEKINSLGTPTLVVLTNRDHEREAEAFRQHFNIPVTAPELDAPLLEHPPARTFRDGDILPGGLQVIHLAHQKSPGESALYYKDRNVLFLGDALLGKPAGQLSMLSEEKYADKAKAYEGLKRLTDLSLETEALLVGDGEPVLRNGKSVLLGFFQA